MEPEIFLTSQAFRSRGKTLKSRGQIVITWSNKNNNIICVYRKAFDSVNRLALWQKLLQQNVNGKMLKIIYSMYESAKSCVRQNNQLSN